LFPYIYSLTTCANNKNYCNTADAPEKKNMHKISAVSRHQMEISSLNCNIDTENVVRSIDAFVDKRDLVKLQL
jgi:hypothetical protein